MICSESGSELSIYSGSDSEPKLSKDFNFMFWTTGTTLTIFMYLYKCRNFFDFFLQKKFGFKHKKFVEVEVDVVNPNCLCSPFNLFYNVRRSIRYPYLLFIPICRLCHGFSLYCNVFSAQDMQIKVSKHVDLSGKIYLPYLHEWSYPNSDLVGLIQVCSLPFDI